MERERRGYNPAMTERAQQMRIQATPAEQVLWRLLRKRRCGGNRFVRQVPVGHYILDFYCASARLAIEVDGGIHNTPDVQQRDSERDNILQEEMRIQTLRLTNDEILNGPDETLQQRILDAIKQAEEAAPPFGERPARRR